MNQNKLKSDFLHIAQERGFIHQATDIETLDALMAKQSITGYAGFDPTGESLHVGHLMPIMWLRWMQKTGHKPLVLMGGATSKIGDPSGKDAARQLLSDEEITSNIGNISQVFSNFLDFKDSPNKAVIVNNADWLTPLNYIEFLRDYGRHFSVNRMLSFDSVKLRLDREQPLSFLEFNYMIFQAYDFMDLYRRMDCVLQLGGSDQWGNIINGVELTRRVLGKTVYGVTSPLIMTSSGQKMGKTANGAIWLNQNLLSSYDYWQFWRNTEDLDVGRYLKLFTELPIDEIGRLEKLQGSEINEAKKILADHATALAHGAECLENIHATISNLFEKHSSADLSSLPVVTITRAELEAGLAWDELFVRSGLVASKGEAKRLIQGGGGSQNGERITDPRGTLSFSSTNGDIKVSVGKKKHFLVRCDDGARLHV